MALNNFIIEIKHWEHFADQFPCQPRLKQKLKKYLSFIYILSSVFQCEVSLNIPAHCLHIIHIRYSEV